MLFSFVFKQQKNWGNILLLILSQVRFYSSGVFRLFLEINLLLTLSIRISLMRLAPTLKPVLWTSLAILSALNAVADSSSNSDSIMTLTCDSPIYCSGDLLHTVQLAEIYSDSKTFVDMVSKCIVLQLLTRPKSTRQC